MGSNVLLEPMTLRKADVRHGFRSVVLMATIIFVHGTGVRKQSYAASRKSIDKGLKTALHRAGRAEVIIADCLWGEAHGSKPAGLSVPEYRKSGGQETGIPLDEDTVLLWEMLGFNSLYELSGLALQPQPSGITLNKGVSEFCKKIATLPSKTLVSRLTAAGIAKQFGHARDYILNQPELMQALQRASSPGQCRIAVARAIVAEAIDRAPGSPVPAVCINPTLRDTLVLQVGDEIMSPDKRHRWSGSLTSFTEEPSALARYS